MLIQLECVFYICRPVPPCPPKRQRPTETPISLKYATSMPFMAANLDCLTNSEGKCRLCDEKRPTNKEEYRRHFEGGNNEHRAALNQALDQVNVTERCGCLCIFVAIGTAISCLLAHFIRASIFSIVSATRPESIRTLKKRKTHLRSRVQTSRQRAQIPLPF